MVIEKTITIHQSCQHQSKVIHQYMPSGQNKLLTVATGEVQYTR